ncbi:hypothetical protein BRD04_03540 [Halobacteriales archaeon QS_9_67_17]|nr:MAG: hypothetical protein BRD04_03540 [Halobacteriales archaeon QS_9_67_17]
MSSSDGQAPADEEMSAEEFEELPTSDIEVEIRIGFGMTGSFPLRLADLFFVEDGLYVAEYEYLTPIFGVGARKHRREAAAMERVYEVHGVDEVLLQADTVVWHAYDNLDRVTLHDGGRLGRPRLGVYPDVGSSHAYRLHDREQSDIAALGGDLDPWLSARGVAFEEASGLGYRPGESITRFFD